MQHHSLIVADAHTSPDDRRARFLALGRHAADTRVDSIWDIGDFSTFDSVSFHETPGSMADRLRPSLKKDLAAREAAYLLIRRGLDRYEPDLMVSMEGNHEFRWRRFVNLNPSFEDL